jgi:hypothetical protein
MFNPDGEQKSNTYKQAPNFIAGQQFTDFFVFNRTVTSRLTKYIANYYKKIVMSLIKATLNRLNIQTSSTHNPLNPCEHRKKKFFQGTKAYIEDPA